MTISVSATQSTSAPIYLERVCTLMSTTSKMITSLVFGLLAKTIWYMKKGEEEDAYNTFSKKCYNKSCKSFQQLNGIGMSFFQSSDPQSVPSN